MTKDLLTPIISLEGLSSVKNSNHLMIEYNQISQNLLKAVLGGTAGTSCVSNYRSRTRPIFIVLGPFASLQAPKVVSSHAAVAMRLCAALQTCVQDIRQSNLHAVA